MTKLEFLRAKMEEAYDVYDDIRETYKYELRKEQKKEVIRKSFEEAFDSGEYE